jgi:hypothetical protein
LKSFSINRIYAKVCFSWAGSRTRKTGGKGAKNKSKKTQIEPKQKHFLTQLNRPELSNFGFWFSYFGRSVTKISRVVAGIKE